ncbi:PEP/pyruvate-binding domain-containing protein [Actinoplanes subtropicus]|uniref:PEP/pyruvate-binding domain-containing protein n=1 Tax=Actinoplanes subtropicus TaxID=543632 RepID=UPI00068E3685|nr:PEP/pyruvate-binding domain-containing protein [Actinoplanes subtropicus]
MRYIRRLAATGLADAAVIGRKAAVLADLTGAGFPVPAGFAVESRRPDLGVLREEIGTALRELGDGPVAVRSSGVDEDLASRSFAGQYESVLDVRGLDAVLDAIRTCWASADADRVAAYRGNGERGEMGVLIQRMVAADAAGVAFSADPVTSDPDEVLVSAVKGLADGLVGGSRSGDEWRVRDGRAILVAGAGSAVDAAQVVAIAALARAVAAHYGTPQDIEWAYAEGKLFLLQARPITTLDAVAPIPIPIEQPEYFSVRDANTVRPWTRLQTSLFLPVFSDAARHVFRFTTGGTPYASSIGGWTYLTNPPVAPAEQLRRLERNAARLAAGEPRALVERWNAEWKPAFRDRLATLRAVTPAELDDAALRVHLGELIVLFGRLHDVYFRLTGAAIVLLAELGVACRDLLGWTPAQTLRLRSGLRGDHMAVTAELAELARLAAARPAVRALIAEYPPDALAESSPDALAESSPDALAESSPDALAESSPDALAESSPGAEQRLAATDPEFAAAFRRYRAAHGHRTAGFDLTQPTLAEQPGVLLNLLRAQLDDPLDLTRERAALQARREAALAEIPDDARHQLAEALAGSDLGTPVRDEKVYYAVSLWALLRYALLDLGRRLADASLVDRPDDVWHLHLTTALAALDRGTPLHEEVRLGRGRHAWAVAHPGPPFYGPPPSDPGDLGDLSPGARHVADLAQWSMSLRAGGPSSPASPADDGALHGLAASAGRYTGPARVIRDITEFGRLRRGDVLVCPETTAQWAVLFPSVGALVTDKGSVLSHPAIIAREYGVPAVLATGTATSTFTDGQLLTVDGTTGVVRRADLPEGISA